MRKYLLLFCMFATIGFLAACDTEREERTGHTYHFDQDRQKPTTITVWVDDTDGEMMDEMIEKFNIKHPDILVEWAHMGTVDAMNQLQMSGPSGNGADIFQFPHDQLATALKHQLLYALPDNFVSNLNNRMSESAMTVATSCYNFQAKAGENPFTCGTNNQYREVFAAPISVETVALFYNKDLVDTPAATFEELLEDAATYTAEQVAAGSSDKYYFNTNWNDSYFINFVLSAHGYIPFGDNMSDPDEVNIDSPEVIAALTWLEDNIVSYYGDGSNAPSIQGLADSAFESGKLPYIITGPWKIETYKKLEGFNFGVTSIPTINVDGQDVAPKPFLGAQMLGVYQNSQHKEAALTFIDFWTSDEGLEIQYRHKGKLPALKDTLMENVAGIRDDEYLAGIREQLKNTVPMPTLAEVEHYWEPIRIMVNDVWNGDTPAAAAKKAEESYNKLRGLTQ